MSSPKTESWILTPQDMRDWLLAEKAQLRLINQQRIKEATAFVQAYETGALTAEEAEERKSAYDLRWPPLSRMVCESPGEKLTDEIEQAAQDKIYGSISFQEKTAQGGRKPRSR